MRSSNVFKPAANESPVQALVTSEARDFNADTPRRAGVDRSLVAAALFITSHSGTPRSTARWVSNLTASLLIPRGGVLMIRNNDASSAGCSIHLRYAITSRTSLRS